MELEIVYLPEYGNGVRKAHVVRRYESLGAVPRIVLAFIDEQDDKGPRDCFASSVFTTRAEAEANQ